jgi:glycosyltransferase involved in cell wall biosynthesis
MKIAIVVPGRLHAFDFAKALSARHEVTLFTNYPKWAVARFGLDKNQVRSCWLHGVAARIANLLRLRFLEAPLHRMFSRWASTKLVNGEWDVVHVFSGVAEEIFASRRSAKKPLRLLLRGSSHIRTQSKILEEEEKRVGCRLDRPSSWMIAREQVEYALADVIVVLSTFACESFLSEGVNPSRVRVLQLGASLEAFRPRPDAIEERCRRILSGEPLRILYVGNIILRKGFWDMAEIVSALDSDRFHFRFVGAVQPEVRWLKKRLQTKANFVRKQPQHLLREQYSWGDIFIFPTLEDGFAVVLAQAAMAGLPILTTTNCAGPDLVREGETGFVLPIRHPASFVDKLKWCDEHRLQLATIVRRIYTEFRPRTWVQVVDDFEHIVRSQIEEPVVGDR